MATLDTVILVALAIVAAAFIYSKFGDMFSRFFQWVKSLGSSSKERFVANARYTKELVYE